MGDRRLAPPACTACCWVTAFIRGRGGEQALARLVSCMQQWVSVTDPGAPAQALQTLVQLTGSTRRFPFSFVLESGLREVSGWVSVSKRCILSRRLRGLGAEAPGFL